MLKNPELVKKLSIDISATLQELAILLEQNPEFGCALVFSKKEFVNILTDGDLRRVFLNGKTSSDAVLDAILLKKKSKRSDAIFAFDYSSNEEIQALFKKHNLRQLVIKSLNGQIVDVLKKSDASIMHEEVLPLSPFDALVMCGGFGTRLRPLTDNTPKPMVKINGVPIMEYTVRSLIAAGVSRIFISTHYLADQIKDYFSDGTSFGTKIEYIDEVEPLGTGGCLKLLPELDCNLLVINGDIYTELNFSMFVAHHVRAKNAVTMGSLNYYVDVPFGVLETESDVLKGFREKPRLNMLVNSGIYVLSPDRRGILNRLSGAFTLPDYIEHLMEDQQRIGLCPVYEKWMDIGTIDDYRRAEDYLKNADDSKVN